MFESSKNWIWIVPAALAFLVGCDAKREGFQGYVEADMVYVSPTIGGRVDRIYVKRGDFVKAGAPLFDQDKIEQAAELAKAEAAAREARADLDDLLKGSRPQELAVLRAKIAKLKSAYELAKIDHERNARLRKSDVIAAKEFDNTRLLMEQRLCEWEEVKRDLVVAELPAREDRVRSAREAVTAADNALAAAKWRFEQRSVRAQRDALVFDVLSREEEYVAAGAAILAMIPPENMKVRFFVPYADVKSVHPGDPARFGPDGASKRYRATIGYVSPKPEYTPPVIYSKDNNEKLVFMIEADVAPEDARAVNPGLPVTVTLSRKAGGK